MKKLLALIPLVAFISACSKPPEITAANAEEALGICIKEVKKEVDVIMRERELARSKPHLFDFERSDYHENFSYPYMISDEDQRITILRYYCKTIRYENWPTLMTDVGYIEYLIEPLVGTGESRVDRVLISFGRVWEEELLKDR